MGLHSTTGDHLGPHKTTLVPHCALCREYSVQNEIQRLRSFILGAVDSELGRIEGLLCRLLFPMGSLLSGGVSFISIASSHHAACIA